MQVIERTHVDELGWFWVPSVGVLAYISNLIFMTACGEEVEVAHKAGLCISAILQLYVFYVCVDRYILLRDRFDSIPWRWASLFEEEEEEEVKVFRKNKRAVQPNLFVDQCDVVY
jgi:hypothetical protein